MPKTYLALDYGTKKTGLAVGNDLTRTAQAIAAIATSQLHDSKTQILPNALKDIIQAWRISHLILGKPLDQDGKETAQSKHIYRFGVALGAALSLPVDFADERYSSNEADRLLRQQQQAGKRFGAKKIALRDSLAAQLILETYFSHNF